MCTNILSQHLFLFVKWRYALQKKDTKTIFKGKSDFLKKLFPLSKFSVINSSVRVYLPSVYEAQRVYFGLVS